MTTSNNTTKHEQERQDLKGKLILAALISIPSIIVMNPTFVPGVINILVPGSYNEGLAWSIIALVSLPVFMWSGSHMLISLKHRILNLESLFGLGLSGAFFYSIAIAIMPGFDTIAPSAVPLWDIIDVVVALALVLKLTKSQAPAVEG